MEACCTDEWLVTCFRQDLRLNDGCDHDQCNYCFVGYSVQLWRSHNVWLVCWVSSLVSSNHWKHRKHVAKLHVGSYKYRRCCKCRRVIASVSTHQFSDCMGRGIGTRSPVLMEIITLGCWKFVFIGGRFASHASMDSKQPWWRSLALCHMGPWTLANLARRSESNFGLTCMVH